MAIIRVNWDKRGMTFLDNYMPLVCDVLDKTEKDIFSVNDFAEKFKEVAEFNIPTGAVISLLKRATLRHQLLERQSNGVYQIRRASIHKSDFSELRDAEQRKYRGLVDRFVRYCKDKHEIEIDAENASFYFFEILYDIAPLLYVNLKEAEKITESQSGKNKFLISQFVLFANEQDQESFKSLLSFVRGSMLTETFFYYQNIDDITEKQLKRINVYFDTQFLLRALGFAQRELCVPCEELIEILKEAKISMFCLLNTLEELRGIFVAAEHQLRQKGRLTPNRPGDVFDHINQSSTTSSDLLIIISTLEDKIKYKEINIVSKPDIITDFSIDEKTLNQKLSEAFPSQSERARIHDIACLQAIFQLRRGDRQLNLSNCEAIFITTNFKLAEVSSLFFSDQYGPFNVPICMGDHLFAFLVWMKSVKKTSDLPKDRLVATCYSALQPSDSLWSAYINEAKRLKNKEGMSENDYHVLIYDTTVRECILNNAILSGDENIWGSVPEILEKAKEDLAKEVLDKLVSSEARNNEIVRNIDLKSRQIGCLVKRIFLCLIYLFLFFIFFYSAFKPFVYSENFDILDITSFFISLIICLITIYDLCTKKKFKTFCNALEGKVSQYLSSLIRKSLGIK